MREKGDWSESLVKKPNYFLGGEEKIRQNGKGTWLIGFEGVSQRS